SPRSAHRQSCMAPRNEVHPLAHRSEIPRGGATYPPSPDQYRDGRGDLILFTSRVSQYDTGSQRQGLHRIAPRRESGQFSVFDRWGQVPEPRPMNTSSCRGRYRRLPALQIRGPLYHTYKLRVLPSQTASATFQVVVRSDNRILMSVSVIIPAYNRS